MSCRRVNEVTQVGLEAVAAVSLMGQSRWFPPRAAAPRGRGADEGRLHGGADPGGLLAWPRRHHETDDPDAPVALRAIENATAHAVCEPARRPKRDDAAGVAELQRAAPAPVDVVALPPGAPFGAVEVNAAGCTLCLACVSACPTGALLDDPERPMLRFAEDACVQCGLCKATCPEKVITLTPQLDFRAATAAARVLKEEEPFHCIRCGKPLASEHHRARHRQARRQVPDVPESPRSA
jgi:ferredoxin